MNMKQTLTGLAIAGFVTASAGSSALAQDTFFKSYDEEVTVTIFNALDVDISKRIRTSKRVGYRGEVSIDGRINVDALGMAVIDHKQVVDQNQWNIGDSSYYGDSATNQTVLGSIQGAPFGSASGNIGLNMETGFANAQANHAALAAVSGDRPSVDAEIFSFQEIYSNTVDFVGVTGRADNEAQVLRSSFENASGNIGVNLAAGGFNAQSNSMVAAVNMADEARLAEATVGSVQQTSWNSSYYGDHGYSNDAVVDDFAFFGASGAIGLNVAAGYGHNQQNNVAMSAAPRGGSQ